MTKAEEFARAWRLAYTKSGYSLIEPILHKDYRCFDHRMGMEVDYQTEKALMDTVAPLLSVGLWKILYENDDFHVDKVYSRHKDIPPRYNVTMGTVHLVDGKLFRHELIREALDYDPSEGQDWNWEDYE
jgi:hypothetical protein